SGDMPSGMKLARELIVPPVISPYRWAADYDGNRLILNGFVPDTASHDSITKAAKTELPDAALEDRMEIAAGAPDGFADAVGFALRQLPRLRSGYVSLTDADLIVKGTAINSQSYSTAKRLLGGELPVGFRMAQEEIVPPTLAPYVWWASFDGAKLVIAGHVPDEAGRQAAIEAARDVLPGIEIDDAMLIAAGSPHTYREATEAALAAFSHLATGRIQLTDLVLTVKGTAKSPSAFSDVESYLAGTLPGGMVLKSSNIQPPAATGDYLWQAMLSDDALVLEGSAPSREARAQIEEKAKELALGRRVDNRMVVETGAPLGFVKIASNSLGLLGNFTRGSTSIRDTSVSVVGDAKTVAAYENVLKSISDKPGRGFKWDRTQIRPAEISPYSWSVEKQADGAKLSGFVPSKNVGNSHVADVVAKLGSAIENRQRIGGGAPEEFAKATAAMIASLVLLDNAKVTITGTTVLIEGRAQSEAQASAIGSDLALALPSNFNLRKRITYPLPKIEPKPSARATANEEKLVSAPETTKAEPTPGSKTSVTPAEEPIAKEPAPTVTTVVPIPKPAPKVCNVNFKSLFRGDRILFETARAVILDESADLLTRIAEGARKCRNAVIEVGGHTDSRGTRRYNLALSEARASAVVDFLTRQGVSADRLIAKGYGESRPIASNRRPKTRSRNRRIEFKVLATQ
ncbi:MAG: OmpA family protein, partial [Rhizobiaceae bacterium]